MGYMLLVHSIFPSLSGEVGLVAQGTPVVFLRLQGCNLRCRWCDAEETQRAVTGDVGYQVLSPAEAANHIFSYQYTDVIITGGEPMMQASPLQELINLLEKGGKRISIESNGSYSPYLGGVSSWILDYKLEYSAKMISFREFASMRGCDWVKIVVWDRESFLRALNSFQHIENLHKIIRSNWSRDTGDNREWAGPQLPRFAISAGGIPRLKERSLAQWLLDSGRENIILNTQMHKLIDLNESTRGLFLYKKT